jgi:uncharacterized membrane protein
MPGGLERTIGRVLHAGVVTSTVCLGAGLALSWTGAGAVSLVLLHIGVVVLLMTPVARVVVSVVEYTQERDWTFVTLTSIVLVELLASVVAALLFNRKL